VRQQRAYTAGLREHAERRAQAQLVEGRRALTEERLRIARELHDRPVPQLLGDGRRDGPGGGGLDAGAPVQPPEGFSLAVQAIGHARSKDKAMDRACEVGHELVAMTSQLASDRVRTQLANVLNALRPYRTSGAVQGLIEAVRPVLRDSPA